MKSIYTKEYYEKYRDVLFNKYKKYCDFEHELVILLPDFSEMSGFSELPISARENTKMVITKICAQKVAARAKEELLKKMHTIQNIKSGKAVLGYTSKQQEIQEWHDLNEGFEFACFMLAEFKRKYGLD